MSDFVNVTLLAILQGEAEFLPISSSGHLVIGQQVLGMHEEGMKLEGVVTNVTAFGVFVDIGVHQDGLIHVSELSDNFVSDPAKVVKTGDRLAVTVIGVDLPRQRISLSAKSKPTVGAAASAGSKTGAPAQKRGPRTSFAPASGSGFSCNPFAGL